MSRRIILLAAASMLIGGAQAATVTANINVTLEIEAECLIISVADLDFGSHGVLAANVDTTGELTVQCTDTTPYTIALGVGNGTGATVNTRLMTGPSSQTVEYSLYRDIGHLQVWGVTDGVNRQGGTGSGIAQDYPIYGRIPPQATPGAGTYSDIITATVEY